MVVLSESYLQNLGKYYIVLVFTFGIAPKTCRRYVDGLFVRFRSSNNECNHVTF